MTNFDSFYAYLQDSDLAHWLDTIPPIITDKLDPNKNGNLNKWFTAFEQLEKTTPDHIELNRGAIKIGSAEQAQDNLNLLLKHFTPWRKGPYELFGVEVDTEWRSDWKWDRLEQHIQPLQYRTVLDVGCGNGYHCLRMLGAGAERVVGIDPGMLSVMQFQIIKHFLGDIPVDVLPLGIEHIPDRSKAFDTVFSMGVLYHRRSPIDHLYELMACLKAGGELVLETLVIEGEEGQVLLPEDRYAQMRNVWFLPSCPTLATWLKRCGFSDIKLVDVSTTSIEEQRTTEWMPFHSLPEFLDPNDHRKTCEGLPAPRRATFTATAR